MNIWFLKKTVQDNNYKVNNKNKVNSKTNIQVIVTRGKVQI